MLRLVSRRVPRTGHSLWLRNFSAESTEVGHLPKAVDTAGRYAYALYNAAKKTNSLDAVISDVNSMQDMVSKNVTLSEFLINPSLPRTAKVEAMTEIVTKAGFSDTFSKFLMVMSENGRTSEASKALTSFQDMIAALKGEVVVKVTTTIPLSEWELALLKKKIKQRFFAGKPDAELTVETAIDEELLGGLTIQVGDRFMDLSTRTELRKLQEVLSQAM
ncbi:F1F0 ATP synthase OSCP/delta subunit [Gracilaria domingensis]|nr:F1F0 ATP synthase OSCP/delta subunit [Gracilaria domingensis]